MAFRVLATGHYLMSSTWLFWMAPDRHFPFPSVVYSLRQLGPPPQQNSPCTGIRGRTDAGGWWWLWNRLPETTGPEMSCNPLLQMSHQCRLVVSLSCSAKVTLTHRIHPCRPAQPTFLRACDEAHSNYSSVSVRRVEIYLKSPLEKGEEGTCIECWLCAKRSAKHVLWNI